MPTREFLCWNCDITFTVKLPKGHEVSYCPCCGELIGEDEDINEYEDE
jgi:Zn-finger nucleic acid-binding protein